ncbi:LysR family transcriptional regulator [Pantoea sp. FN060301]|uniref:LysR family transcriptional regulator n=1 Tax=Pantoea sp. FN060301 TaxID=3420380 RepID=UPI003D1775B1
MQLEDLRIYTAVVSAGNFTAAAEKLMLSKQYVSRRMAALEASLGARLLIRNTRKLSVTDAGQLFARHAQRILDDVFEAEQAVTERRKELQGTFRLSMPMSFGMNPLSPLISAFLTQHPAIQLQVELADRYVDVIGEGFDMAIRIGSLSDSSLIARSLGSIRRIICASPAYLERRGVPLHPDDLQQHACLRFGREGQSGWELNVNGKRKITSVQGPVMSNNGEVLADAAIAGLGLVLLPEFIVEGAIAQGKLISVMETYHPESLPLSAVYPQHRQRSEITRALLDFLKESPALRPQPVAEK